VRCKPAGGRPRRGTRLVTLAIDDARALAFGKLRKHGMAANDANTVSRHLVTAELRGYSSHGLWRLPSIVAASGKAVAAPRLDISLPALVTVDGGGSQGIVCVNELLRLAREKAEAAGTALGGLRNYRGTTGCLGVYGAELAAAGFVSILMCNAEHAVAPFGGARAVIGTNPIAVSIPTRDFPFVADIATAARSYGALHEAMAAGARVPEGLVQTGCGEPSTDPREADRGSQLPMSGHKGYALGLAIELLCGPLLGAKAGRDAVPGSDGFLAVVIDPARLRPRALQEVDTDALFAEVRAGPLAPGFEEIRIPGQKAHWRAARCGKISINRDVYAALNEL